MRYFTISEMIASDTAKVKGIDNSPTTAVRANLVALIETLLDPLREAWKSPIKVTSGYRCPELNRTREIRGSSTSAHLYGYAADIVPINGEISKFKAFCLKYFGNRRHLFDQVILEQSKGSEWVHIGLKTKDGRKRGQLMVYC